MFLWKTFLFFNLIHNLLLFKLVANVLCLVWLAMDFSLFQVL